MSASDNKAAELRQPGFDLRNPLTRLSLEKAQENLIAGLADAEKLDDVHCDADGYTCRERAEMLCGMSYVTSVFYGLAVATHVHAFHEFSGLMSNFEQACAEAERAGRRWVNANHCAGQPLRFHSQQLKYIDDKLRCMFGFGLALDGKGKGR